ncbi:zinc-ribbon domain-containing protein [Lactiplantibacillus pentosus]|uniref:zinc ribbon domain-containing protein n=1 Tax=Lactiplantibacillus pentosus TaxID=1589 RepID=UPI001F2C8E43|nr:zinc ribbon domain-containing protein [Lactiplantibacillus pentosus]MCE6031791.1 zinc-ribbon domain-containing protein [Lactiplantibacillus pentosus]
MTNQPDFCPKCGNEIKPDAKFCPKCGYAVQEVRQPVESAPIPQSTPQATDYNSSRTSDSIASVKRFSGNYFAWYLETLRHPSRPLVDANRFFGLTSMVVESLLMVLTIVSLIQKVRALVVKSVGTEARDMMAALDINGVIVKTGLTIFLLIIVGYAIYTAIAYGFRQALTPEHVDFWDFVNQFAGVTNLIMILNLITLLMSVITSSGNFSGLTLLLIFMVPSNVLMSAAFIFIIVNDVQRARMDKFYAVLLAEVALTVVFSIFIFIVLNIFWGSLVGYVQNVSGIWR